MSQLYSITLRGGEILELLFTAHPNVYFAGAHFKAWKEILRKTGDDISKKVSTYSVPIYLPLF